MELGGLGYLTHVAIVFEVRPKAVTNIAAKSTDHSSIALSWTYREPQPPGLIYRLQYHSERRPAYKVQSILLFLC